MSDPAQRASVQTKAAPTVMRLLGERFVPDISGALYHAASETLIVADLHFEKGSSFASRGVHLPPYDTRSTLFRLRHVIEHYAPKRVIALGDSFHDGDAGARLSDEDAADIRALTGRTRWIWITGNHDPEPPGDLGGEVMDAYDEAPLRFEHIPTKAPATGQVAGHLHPVACVAARGRRLRRRCFVTDGARLILPAFGAYTGGLDVREDAFRELFDGGRFTAWMLGRDRVYPVSSKKVAGTG